MTCKTVNNATARHNAKKVKGGCCPSLPLPSFRACVLLLRHSSRPRHFRVKEGANGKVVHDVVFSLASMNCPTSCCRLSFSRLVRPMDQLLISGRRRRRRALSIHWHLHFDFLLVARAAAARAHPLLSVLLSSRPPSSNHVLVPASLRLCYSTNRMMEVAAPCSLLPLSPGLGGDCLFRPSPSSSNLL